MPLPWTLALCALLQAAPAVDARQQEREKDVLGRWTNEDTVLVLAAKGEGTLIDRGPETPVRWYLEPTGKLHLSFEGGRADCFFTQVRDRVLCRSDGGGGFRRPLLKEGWKPKPPPAARPCTLKVIEGTSAGPIRLGMKQRELEKLRLPYKFARDPKSPEWLAGGPYRVRFDAAGAAVQIIVDASEDAVLCLERGPNGADCPLDLGSLARSGGEVRDCPAAGVKMRKNFLGNIEDIEIFPPVTARPASPGPDDCTVWVKPGVSMGPFRVGMSRKAASDLGLGLKPYDPSGRSLVSGPYLVTFDLSTDTIASIRVPISQFGTRDRACFESGPIAPDWKREELCAHGFCACSIERDAVAKGIAHARCPEGVRFDFEFAPPGKLFVLEVVAPAK